MLILKFIANGEREERSWIIAKQQLAPDKNFSIVKCLKRKGFGYTEIPQWRNSSGHQCDLTKLSKKYVEVNNRGKMATAGVSLRHVKRYFNIHHNFKNKSIY